MEEFVAYIIKNLVSNPENVQVIATEDQEKIRIEIRVSSEDVGKVIGRRGNTINALRTIVRTVATRLGRKAQVELVQPDHPAIIVEESGVSEEDPAEEAVFTS
jgi:predicted RNA-binding protein YlqC (UPF0109 family)